MKQKFTKAKEALALQFRRPFGNVLKRCHILIDMKSIVFENTV